MNIQIEDPTRQPDRIWEIDGWELEFRAFIPGEREAILIRPPHPENRSTPWFPQSDPVPPEVATLVSYRGESGMVVTPTRRIPDNVRRAAGWFAMFHLSGDARVKWLRSPDRPIR